ncbi:carbohydrate ABC transporter permease [Martelella sp. AMO21009]
MPNDIATKSGVNPRSNRTNSLQARRRREYVRFLYPTIFCAVLFSVVPLAGMFALSLTDFHLIKGWGGHWGLQNFVRLLSDRRFLNSIYVMLALSVGGVVVQLVIGTAIAVGLDQIVPKWKVARGLFTIPFAVPHVAVALIWLSLYTPTLSPINAALEALGLPQPVWFSTQTGAIAAIVIADTWANFPFVMLLILAALQGIPRDLKEAAAIDGASQLRAFFVITLPLLKPALLLVTLFRFIETLKHFPLIYVITKGGPGRSTQATNYYAYVQSFENSNISYGAAISVTLFLFAALASYWVARINSRINA